MFAVDNRMAGYRVEPTPERPTDDACEARFVAAPLTLGACNGREFPLSMRSLPLAKHSLTREPLPVRPGGFGKSADKLSEHPGPYRPKASRAVFEQI